MAAETLNTRYEIIEAVPEADTLPFTVAKARDTAEDRIVTLQTLPAARIGGTPRPRAAFQAAAQQAARLDHPNIARVYDQGTTEAADDLFVASEYMRGITLKERIRRIAPFSLAVAADIAVAVAEALEYAHAAGVAARRPAPAPRPAQPRGADQGRRFRLRPRRRAAHGGRARTRSMRPTPRPNSARARREPSPPTSTPLAPPCMRC